MVIHRQTTYVTFCSECDTGPKLTNFPKGEPVRYFEENLEAERLYINLIQKATEVLHSFFDSTTIFYSKHTTKTVEIWVISASAPHTIYLSKLQNFRII